MLKIGLTGGIGSGKTTVAKIFELLGVPVYYADEASKRLYHTNADLKKQVKDIFGDDIYVNDQLDRSKLAKIVFTDPAKLEVLNRLVHPLTISDAENWMKAQNSTYAIKEAALIFESNAARSLDLVIGVTAPWPLRQQRVMERDQTTREEVIRRATHQIDESMKMKLCDFVIRNDEQELLIPQVLALHNQLLTMPEPAKPVHG